ncbi:hypothetical protein GJV07_10810 [Enterobacteriaceae bacterium RIT711]|nr:hypothetical protein [Enterobacteriaceae bacterium RIT711]
MATRPVYTDHPQRPYVIEQLVQFQWHAGFAVSQKQKSISEFHKAIIDSEVGLRPLEISTKSENSLGVALSAFNLSVTLEKGGRVAIENLFQGAKIFERGGPFKDLLRASPLDAKRDPRLKESGNMTGFQGKEGIWPLEPKTLFYDWLYINALHRTDKLALAVQEFDAFTDIEFNPAKSFNCQARSVALYVALTKCGEIDNVIRDSAYYRTLVVPDVSSDTTELQLNLI